MNITGKVTIMNSPITVGKDLLKRQIVVVAEDKNQVCLDFMWDNVKLLDWINQWDEVTATFALAINIASNGAIFNRISGTSIALISKD